MNTNGNAETELPEDRQKTVEAGLALFQQVQAERDHLRETLRKAEEEITRQRVEIDSLHQLHNMLESHIQSYMMQRDEAVAHRAAYETLFSTVQAQLRVFNLPATPLVKDHGNQDVVSGHVADPVPSAGGGQRTPLPDAPAGTGQVPRRSPVLAHSGPVLGQRPGRTLDDIPPGGRR